MNLLQPWNTLFLVALVVYFSIRGRFVRRLKLSETKTIESRFGRLEKWLLFGMSIAVLLLPVLYLFTPWLNFANYELPVMVPAVGSVVLAISLWLFWRSHADLAENWSVSLEVREGHQLVTQGVYRRIRHPMYASIWLWAIAQGMMLENWLAGWAAVPAFGAMCFLRVPREEGLMVETFGDEYRAYMRVTRRLYPRMGGTREAASGDES